MDEFDVRAVREAAGLTQVELAERLGKDQRTVSKLESQQGLRMTLTSLRSYIAATGAESAVVTVKVSGRTVTLPLELDSSPEAE